MLTNVEILLEKGQVVIMTRKERYKAIFEQFDKCANYFCKDIGGLYCGIKSIRKEKERLAEIYCNSSVIVFRFTKDSILGLQHNILDCLIRFGKSDNDLLIPLPFVFDFCEENILEPLCFPYITNEQAMKEAFQVLSDAVKRLLPEIFGISCDSMKNLEMERYYIKEYATVFDNSKNPVRADDAFIRWLLIRFSSSYILFFKGKPKKAVNYLKKMKYKLRYESRLLELLNSGEVFNCERLPSIVSNMKYVNNQGVPGIDGRMIIPYLLSALSLTVLVSAVYIAFYFLIRLIQMNNSILLTGVIRNFPYCIIAGMLSSTGLSYFAGRIFARFLFKKQYESISEQEQMNISATDDKIMLGFNVIIIIGSIIFTILVSTWNINFKANGFIDNTSFFSVKGKYYDYSEIDYIAYVPSRTNDYEEMLEYPSYKIVLKSGKEIDLYEYADIKEYDPKILDYLRNKGVKIYYDECANIKKDLQKSLDTSSVPR